MFRIPAWYQNRTLAMTHRTIGLALLVTLALGTAALAENWPQWRGPNFNGSSSETNLPDTLEKEKAAWSVDLPGIGAGTPIVWGDRVFVSAVDKDGFKLAAICFDRLSGKPLWRKDLGTGFTTNRNHNMGGPSAVTDGKTVFFYFGTGDLGAFDLEGNELWRRSITKDHGSFNFMWIYGSSPLLYKDKLYIQVLHNERPYGGRRGAGGGEGQPGKSYLLGIDPKTGKDLFKEFRPTEANNESQEAYTTPMPCEAGGKSIIVVVGGDAVTGHDPETGKELWRGGDWNPNGEQFWRLVPSVVIANDLAIACAPKGGPVMAFPTSGSGPVKEVWRSNKITSDVPVPLFYKGNLYILNGDGRKYLACVNPADGQVKWQQPIESRPVFRASPTGADNKIYCMNEGGEVYVLSAEEPKLLSQMTLGTNGQARASISASGGMLFVRTGDKLYAFKK